MKRLKEYLKLIFKKTRYIKFLDLWLIPGPQQRQKNESQKIWDINYLHLMKQISKLQERLKRYEG